MNSLSVVIFNAILINILFGYKTNCTRDIRIPCAVYLTPCEDAYRKLLQTIDPYDKLNYGIGLGPYDTDWKKIRKENQPLKKLGDQTIQNFLRKLPNVGPGVRRSIEIIPHIYSVLVPSDFPSFSTTKKPLTWKDVCKANRRKTNRFMRPIKPLLRHNSRRRMMQVN